jgi:hypothetical protein
MNAKLLCPKCGKEPQQSETRYGLRSECCGLWSWNGKQLVPGEVHEARKVAHAAFDPIWQNGLLKRKEAYGRLSQILNIPPQYCHIANLSLDEALRVPSAAQQILDMLKASA